MSVPEIQELVKQTVQPQQAPLALPEEDMRRLTDAVNTLIAHVVRIIITHDPEECASTNKYNRPCDTCQEIADLRAPARTIIRISERLRRTSSGV